MHVHSLIGLSVGGVCGKADTTEFQEFSFLLAPGSLCWGCQAMLTSDDAEAKNVGFSEVCHITHLSEELLPCGSDLE